MNETDDRLAGDPVWEHFAQLSPAATLGVSRARRFGRWLLAAGLIVLGWCVFPPLAIVTACGAIAARDFRTCRQRARSHPKEAGRRICARFRYAWGALKVAATAFAMTFLTIGVTAHVRRVRDDFSTLVAWFALTLGGLIVSAGFTALGIAGAYRSGMRVWIGEGVNQARTLFISMLLVVFTFTVIGPICSWLVGRFPRASQSPEFDYPGVVAFCVCWFLGPFGILLIVDWISRHVVAEGPSKFGPKVPTVGKWTLEQK
jgi:hypothetical protein